MEDLYNIINEAFLIKKNQKHPDAEKISCVRRNIEKTSDLKFTEIQYKNSALGQHKSLKELITMVNGYINKVKEHNGDPDIYDDMLDELEDITGFSYATFKLKPESVIIKYHQAYDLIKQTFDKNELIMCLTIRKGTTKEYYFIYK